METDPVPIVILTASYEPSEVEKTFRALDAGAVAILEKPSGPDHPDFSKIADNLVKTVKTMAEVKLVKRRPGVRSRRETISCQNTDSFPSFKQKVDVIAIGASTGGPPAIKKILSGLAGDFPIPLLMVQHMALGFQDGMVRWLQETTGFPVSIARAGESIGAPHAYLAPDNFHLGVDGGCRVLLSAEAPIRGLRPSVSYLFRSVASFFGCRAVGVLLTGMGDDGARELRSLLEMGGITIAQDCESAVVDGMPGRAREIGAALWALPPERIAAALNGMAPPSNAGKHP
jgi:two-component system chemotaxis response regulator CheB